MIVWVNVVLIGLSVVVESDGRFDNLCGSHLLVMSLVRFDPSIVTVKPSFIVSKIVGCPVVLS